MDNTVIACVDGSSSTRAVCEYAAWIAGKLDVPLALLHAKTFFHPMIKMSEIRITLTYLNRMREALKRYGAKPTREDDGYICDLYEAGKVAPGARQMAICYGPGTPAPLGFLELDYAAPNNKVEAQILSMVTERFGQPSAGEGDDAHLWNLGSVVVATRYEPTRSQLSLMYMVPKVYYQTRQR